MIEQISPINLAALMASDGLFAVFDVRERGEYNDGQIANTSSLPRSQIEFRIAQLVPNRRVAIVVYDEGGSRAGLAATTLAELGYEDVSVLSGGLSAWRREQRETVSGVNVPSKAFGERVQHERAMPDLSAEELKALLDCNAELTIVDVRTPEEYGRFCIPGGINVPGGDLILWAEELRGKQAVIVNCAGRTRSIIGTAALRRLGLTNVRALRNGTMGWLLAGYELEQNPPRQTLLPKSSAHARAAALQLAADENVSWIAAAQLAACIDGGGAGVTYVIDVRSEAEYAAGHVAESINLPGGQAVQRADDFVPVRHGRIIFVSNLSARAVMTAYWYRQMGFKNVGVLQGGLEAWHGSGRELVGGAPASEPLGFEAAKRAVRFVDATQMRQRIERRAALLLDVRTSLEYESAHMPGARWISRGWLDVKVPELVSDPAQAIALTCADGRQSTFAARQLARLGFSDVTVLDGGFRAWSAADYQTHSGLTECLVPANDVVLSPSIRGSKQDMLNYLNWELNLKH